VPEIDVPPGLDAIVLKCLSKKAEARYGAMDELVADLEKLERGTLPDAVGEMMARSGGFNVPADYFRANAMPAPVPGTPREPKKRWPLFATIGAVGTLVGIVAVVLARSPSTPAQTPGAMTSPAPIAPPTLAPPLAAAPPSALAPAPAVSIAPVMHEVLVSVTPADATVTRDGNDLGPSPFVLKLSEGQGASLVIAHKGYKTKTVKVDSSSERQTFTLDPTWSPAAKPAAPPSGGGGIDDVGDPFAKKH
jgi:serine/threonine-protein kinase